MSNNNWQNEQIEEQRNVGSFLASGHLDENSDIGQRSSNATSSQNFGKQTSNNTASSGNKDIGGNACRTKNISSSGSASTENVNANGNLYDNANSKICGKERGDSNSAQKPPKKSVTVFLIISTMMLSLGLILAGVYSLYISIGFSFLNRSMISGINTSSLYTYSNSGFGTGGGAMVGLIIVSIIMLGLGIAMVVIFFKQLPLYRQIKLIAKMPNVKYKQYSQQTKKSVIVLSIIAYIIAIGFSVFAIFIAARESISVSYKWVVLLAYSVVLGLAICSMVLMFVKLAQLSKIKKQLLQNEDLSVKKEVQSAYNQGVTDAQSANKYIEKAQPMAKEQSISMAAETTGLQGEPIGNFGYSSVPSGGYIAGVAANNGVIDATNAAALNLAAANILQANAQIKPQPNKNGSENKLFTDGIFELGDQLQKLREIYVSGLIDQAEYAQIRQKWISAVLKEPLFSKTKASNKSIKKSSKEEIASTQQN